MKTIFTQLSFRTLTMTLVIAISTLNLVGQTLPKSYKVSVTDYKFTPSALTITAGDTVIWTLVSTATNGHNVDGMKAAFPNNPVEFGNTLGKAWTYKFVFNTPGTYGYHCDPHAGGGMVGSVIVNASTTGTEELAGKTGSIQLYPNPASEYIELLIPGNIEKTISLKVYSITGSLIDQKVVAGNVGSFKYDVSGFKKGVYFVKINSATHKNTLKFVKQ